MYMYVMRVTHAKSSVLHMHNLIFPFFEWWSIHVRFIKAIAERV